MFWGSRTGCPRIVFMEMKQTKNIGGVVGMKKQKIDIEAHLEKGGIIQVSPIGYSMYPMLVPGRDMVWIEKADRSRLRRGDVALYRRKGSILVLHRIWKRRADAYFFVGDNQKEIEGPLPGQQICGKMVGFERKGKYVSANHPAYRLISAVWLWLRPFRPVISAAIHKMRVGMKGKKESF